FGVLQELEVQAAERQGGGREVAPVDGLDAQVGGEEGEQVLLGDEAEVEEEALQALAPLLLQPFHLAQVVLGDAALLDQELLERAVRELLHGAPSSIPACFPSGKHEARAHERGVTSVSRQVFGPGCPHDEPSGQLRFLRRPAGGRGSGPPSTTSESPSQLLLPPSL